MSYCRKDSLKESLLTVNNLNFSEQTSICYEKIQNHSSCTNYQNDIISDFPHYLDNFECKIDNIGNF